MCSSPLIKKLPTASSRTGALSIPVPCGKCPKCVKKKIGDWTFRLNQELKRSTSAYFVTLTYDNDNVPWTHNNPPFKDYTTLDRKAIPAFMKRLRFHSKQTGLKYYACGEYGTKRKRPHYHMLLLNLDNPELIHSSWNQGHTYSPPLKDGGVGYVLKYMAKQSNRKEIYGREKEFSLMSKGIGSNYLTSQALRFHLYAPENSYCTVSTGATISLPKYFKEKIYPELMRSQVTEYQKNRAEQLEKQAVKKIMAKNHKLTEDDALNILQFNKINSTFEKRINEVL